MKHASYLTVTPALTFIHTYSIIIVVVIIIFGVVVVRIVIGLHIGALDGIMEKIVGRLKMIKKMKTETNVSLIQWLH